MQLYHFFRSGTSHRLRIALRLKGIEVDLSSLDLRVDEHLKPEFSAIKNPHCDFGENLENYYKYCMRNDLFLTHALGDPQVDRSEAVQNARIEGF